MRSPERTNSDETRAGTSPRLKFAAMTAEQSALREKIVDGPRGSGPVRLIDDDGSLRGPFDGFLLSPPVGDAMQQLGSAIRYRATMPATLRELAILAVAAAESSRFEQEAHQAVARSLGITEEVMADIAARRQPVIDDAADAAGFAFTCALLRGDVSDDEWDAQVPVIGSAIAFELIALVGYYRSLALQMRVLRVDTADSYHGVGGP